MSIESVVLTPSGFNMVDQCLPARPRTALQIVEAEGAVEQFALVEPGSMDRGESRPPPGVRSEIFCGGGCGMAGIAILDEKDAAQVLMMLAELLQGSDVMAGILALRAEGLHLSGWDNQKQQHVDSAMADVLKLLLLHGAGDGASNWVALEGLEIGHLVRADNPKSFSHQSVGVGIAPQNLLGTVFEVGIHTGRLPIAGAMRLQIDLVQDVPHATGAQMRNNAIGHGLAGQLLATPVGDVQSFGDRLQAGQLYDLRPGQRGKFRPGGPCGQLPPERRPSPFAHSDGKPARRSRDRIASARPQSARVRPRPWPAPDTPVEPGTMAGCGCAQFVATTAGHGR
jgi:hypothetical protein